MIRCRNIVSKPPQVFQATHGCLRRPRPWPLHSGMESCIRWFRLARLSWQLSRGDFSFLNLLRGYRQGVYNKKKKSQEGDQNKGSDCNTATSDWSCDTSAQYPALFNPCFLTGQAPPVPDDRLSPGRDFYPRLCILSDTSRVSISSQEQTMDLEQTRFRDLSHRKILRRWQCYRMNHRATAADRFSLGPASLSD